MINIISSVIPKPEMLRAFEIESSAPFLKFCLDSENLKSDISLLKYFSHEYSFMILIPSIILVINFTL